jgi:hypothetical protein
MRQQALLWFIRAAYVFICAMFVLMLGIGSVGFIAIMVGIWWQWEKAFRRCQLSRPREIQLPIVPDHPG